MLRCVFLLVFILKFNNAILDSEADTLVLLDNLSIRETHSIFFKALQERGFKLHFKLADDSNLLLSRYGEYLYKNIILFAPSVEEFGGNLDVEKLTQFVDNGGNILAAGSEQSGDALREFASECGFELDEEGASVIDHLHYDISDAGDHTMICTSANNLINATAIVNVNNGVKNKYLVYKGSGILVDKANPLVLQLLTSENSAYSHNPKRQIKNYPHAIGRNTVLIAALQARNNARVVFSASLYFFSNEAFNKNLQCPHADYKATANKEVAIDISKWVFAESGRLRVAEVKHHRLDEEQPPEQAYTIMDPVVYSIAIEELVDNKWLPYKANDIQMEFVRIDPFVRITMKQVIGSHYEAKFKIPDVYGVYQFKINYDRIGYTTLYNTTQVSIRPLEHTEYERFISSAFPYYTSAFSMMVGVFAFSFAFLHYKEDACTSTKNKFVKKIQ